MNKFETLINDLIKREGYKVLEVVRGWTICAHGHNGSTYHVAISPIGGVMRMQSKQLLVDYILNTKVHYHKGI